MLETPIKINGIPQWDKDTKGIDNILKGAISHCFDVSRDNIEILSKREISNMYEPVLKIPLSRARKMIVKKRGFNTLLIPASEFLRFRNDLIEFIKQYKGQKS